MQIINPTFFSSEDLIKKYRFAGRMRLISFALLLIFLSLMKWVGGYPYLNIAFISLIFIEGVINQPYSFIIKRVNIHRFQYFQMAIDIISISWILYYMGGIDAPLVSIGYYVVILWAGVVSSAFAVFFAVAASVICFSLVVLLEYQGILPMVSLYEYKMPVAQMWSLFLGNVSFLFAFGYFSARSSIIIKFLERKRYEESLKNVHRFLEAGYLLGSTVHETLNCLFNIDGFAKIILEKMDKNSKESEFLTTIQKLGQKSSRLLSRLSKFSRLPKHEFVLTDINRVIDDSLELSWPIVRYSKMIIKKSFKQNIPMIMASRDSLQEVFVVFILNSLDAIADRGVLIIKSDYLEKDNVVEIIFSDTGKGIEEEDLKKIRQQEPFFAVKGEEKRLSVGLSAAYEIISWHNGKINVESTVGRGTTFGIQFPAAPSNI